MLVEGQSERCDVMISLLSILCALEANTYHTKLVYYNPLRQIPKGTFAVNRAHTYIRGFAVYVGFTLVKNYVVVKSEKKIDKTYNF